MQLKIQRQARIVRARLRQPVDLRRAFFDTVIVNVYGGPGTTNVWLGQIEQAGRIPPVASMTSGITTVGYDRAATGSRPQRKSNRLIVGGRPFFPRIIEHRGEPFSALSELGFNTIALRRSPSADQRRQAKELGIWLIAPPPREVLSLTHSDDRILAWFCGDNYAPAKMPSDYLDQIRRRDPKRRPLVAAVSRDQWRASRELDVLLRTREPLGSSFELSHFGPWLDQQNQLTRPGTPFWSYVQTELPAETTAQTQRLVDLDVQLPRVVQVEQVRQLALAAVAAGARGLWFRSDTPLDGVDPESQLRRLMVELINYELALIEPWGIGGQRIGDVPCENAEFRVVALATERTRLLIPTYVQPYAQFACRPTSGGNTLVIAGVSDSTNVFLLSHVGLTPMRRERISGGLRIELKPENADSLVLLTEDPLVVTHINRTVINSKKRVVEIEQDLADRLLSDFETSSARELLKTSERVETWETARLALQASRDLAQANDLSSAYRFARQSTRELNKLQADVWREMTRNWPSPLRHPGAASFALASAVNLSANILPPERNWSHNRLRGGECENLNLMIDAGWRQHQTAPDDISTYIALSPHKPHGGRTCLRVMAAARTTDADQSVVEFAPVWINSAPITVEPGQRVRISGWIRINETIRGSLDGCMIGDSMSGPSLAVRRQRTDGWERFQMIRAVTRPDHLSIIITLHGLGEVWIDDLEVEVDVGSTPRISSN